jgi:hypothetical protein
VSSHFSELSEHEVNEFTIDEFRLILNETSLMASSEDSLYNIISSHFEDSLEWFYLLEFIHFEFRSISSIDHFIQWTQIHSFDFTRGLWEHICLRLAIDVHQTVKSRFLSISSINCSFKPESPLEGIISYLPSRFNGNVSDGGIASVTSKSTSNDFYAVKNGVSLTATSRFSSKGEANQWLCYDFKDRRVEVRHYAIRSQFDGDSIGYADLKSWVIEGSVEGNVWTALDSQQNNSEMNERNLIASWPTSIGMKSRYIRLHQTGKNHNNNDHLNISSWELFGTQIE